MTVSGAHCRTASRWNSACDWGDSDPLAVPKLILEMRRRGYDDATIARLVYDNPCRFLGQSPNFKLRAENG